MKPSPAHHFHIYPSEALREESFEFGFRRADLLRTASLYSNALTGGDADALVGHLAIRLNRVNSGLYLAYIEFRLDYVAECCYCLENTDCAIEDKARTELKTEDKADSYLFSDNQAFDCRLLFEEEVLLRAPINPHHEGCSIDTALAHQASSFVTMSAATGNNDDREGATWRPFANIRSLIDS